MSDVSLSSGSHLPASPALANVLSSGADRGAAGDAGKSAAGGAAGSATDAHAARMDRRSFATPSPFHSSSPSSSLDAAHAVLAEQLRAHALVIGEVTLTSGATASYYVDAKRAILLPEGFAALSTLLAAQVREWNATAVGGMTMGADAVACAALAGGAPAKGFFVRKQAKQHGLQRRIEGPLLTPADRCVVVDDVVSTGGSTVAAIQALQDAGLAICGVVSVLDRLSGAAEAIAAAVEAPYVALTTIDEVYPERPVR